MASTARSAPSARSGGPAPPRRSRPLSRDYGKDTRSAELAESMGVHQRVISEHEAAMIGDIAEFDRTEAWRGDGALSMLIRTSPPLSPQRAQSRALVESHDEVEPSPAPAPFPRDG